jgi:hypothetical protein
MREGGAAAAALTTRERERERERERVTIDTKRLQPHILLPDGIS